MLPAPPQQSSEISGRVLAGLLTLGWIVLLSSLWLLLARTLGWDNANWWQAGTFGVLVYLGFRYSR